MPPLTHIRVLKYEARLSSADKVRLDVRIVLSLTSDLGDSTFPTPTLLDCTLHLWSGDYTETLQWTGFANVQKYEFAVPYKFRQRQDEPYAVSISARLEQGDVQSESRTLLTRFIGRSNLILDVQFQHVVDTPFEARIERSFKVGERTMTLTEETKSSIVAHVWDGGLLLSSLLAALVSRDTEPQDYHDAGLARFMPESEATFTNGTRVVELGTGVGLLGLVCSHLPGLEITVTDLDTAKDLVLGNSSTAKGSSDITFETLDWDDIGAAQNLKKSRPIDVLIMSDVTYNDASHDALRNTIFALCSKHTKIVFASKFRHASERPFIQQLKTSYNVLAGIIADGDTFDLKTGEVKLGDIEVLILGGKLPG